MTGLLTDVRIALQQWKRRPGLPWAACSHLYGDRAVHRGGFDISRSAELKALLAPLVRPVER